MALKDDVVIVGAVSLGVVVLGYFLYKRVESAAGAVADVAGDAVEAVTPTNPDNVFYSAFTDGYQWLTGSSDELGTDLYELVHGVDVGNNDK